MNDDMKSLGITAPSDPLEGLIVEAVYGYRAEQRIYPDTFAADLASRVREFFDGVDARLKAAENAWDMTHFGCDNPDHSAAYKAGAIAFGYAEAGA